MTHHVVADLLGRERTRAITQLALALLPPDGASTRPVLLLNAPRGDGVGRQWRRAPLVESPVDLVPADALAAADDWALTASFRIAEACRGALEHDGFDVAALSLCMLQDWLHEYALLALALRAQVRRAGTARLTVVSPDPGLARALEQDLRADGSAVRRTLACRAGHALHGLADELWHRRTRAALPARGGPGPISDALRTAESPDVLLVAESRPMELMFAACAPAMRARGLSVLHLQLGGAAALARPAEAGRIAALSPIEAGYPGAGLRLRAPDLRDVVLPPLADGTRLSPPWRRRLAWRMQQLRAVQCRYLDDLQTALTHLRPRAIVVGNDRWWIGQAVVQVARRLGVPTVALQDGIMFALPRCWWLAADVGAVNGRHMYEAMSGHGVPPERLAIVGQPRYDEWSAGPAHAEARTRLALAADACVALVATQPDQAPAYAHAVVGALLDRPDVQVILRPHPSMDARPLAALAAAAPAGRVRLDAATPIEVQLAAADVVVVQNSTVCVEAALCGVPVITCTLNGLPDLVPYGALGLATAVRSPAALRRALDDVLARVGAPATLDDERRARLEHLVGPLDGRSATRVAALVEDLVAGRRAAAC